MDSSTISSSLTHPEVSTCNLFKTWERRIIISFSMFYRCIFSYYFIITLNEMRCIKTALYLTNHYRQTIELSLVQNITNKIITNNLRSTVLQHELPEADLTQGRGTPDKSFVFKSVSLLFSSSLRLFCYSSQILINLL